MLRARLVRERSTVEGTFGTLTITNGYGSLLVLSSIELPWKENKRNVSCIPAGSYLCMIEQSNKYGLVYEIKAVKDRSGILIHAGNVAGDKDAFYRSDVEGCILLGMRKGRLYDQQAVLNSKQAISCLRAFTGDEQMELEIEWQTPLKTA